MNTLATETSTLSEVEVTREDRATVLLERIKHATHLLPAQGPITAFVHHNTLHALEDLPFEQAVLQGAEIFGCHPYLPEEEYRRELARGRIAQADIESVLIEDLGDRADELIGFFGTRYQLRLAMLAHPLLTGPAAELRWIVAETAALKSFRKEALDHVRDQTVADTRHWVMRDLRRDAASVDDDRRASGLLGQLFGRFDEPSIESWSNATWESFTLHAMWQLCRIGVSHGDTQSALSHKSSRLRDLFLEAIGQDADWPVNTLLIRFCAAFLDQGFAPWALPEREKGFYHCFLHHFSRLSNGTSSFDGLKAELRRLKSNAVSPVESIAESLAAMGVAEDEQERFLSASLLALRGYAGMIWQLESRGDRAAWPAPEGSLVEYLAVRLVLERVVLQNLAREHCGFRGPLSDLRPLLEGLARRHQTTSDDQLTFELFQLAQVIGWRPSQLAGMSPMEWTLLIRELESFSGIQRRRVYHLAFERGYRMQALDAVAIHDGRVRAAGGERPANVARPAFQLVCCIDDREESFRRHLEEVAPDCETLGAAGFFAVAMYYRGAADAHFTPLCPVIVTPRHYIVEDVVFTEERSNQRRKRRRQVVGTVTHRAHVGSRTFAGGWLAAVLGSLASIPLVMRILFPRATARLRNVFGAVVRTPALTRLNIERRDVDPGPENGSVGYRLEEMAAIVERLLRDMGVTRRLSRLVVICGHGSSSLNNPHEAAHDCGACGGGRGGPNARAFAQMANDPRVRERVAEGGLKIPDDTVFLGAYHNTCDDSVEFYDLSLLPTSHNEDFKSAKAAIDEARARSAHERCRRFETAELTISVDAALRHVEGRAEDLSQVRPEYGHATNSLCFVGRREWSRNLFLDRRAFLQSYEPDQDDENQTILTRILQAVIPVCAGINLEYYFSRVDPTGFGCGTKLPHNITSLLGVMNGAASDLLPGLPWQMVEIHEPVRLLFIIETSTDAMRHIIDGNPAIATLVRGRWVQVATIDPATRELSLFRGGEFVAYRPSTDELPTASSSIDWYRGWRDHLGFATIEAPGSSRLDVKPEVASRPGAM